MKHLYERPAIVGVTDRGEVMTAQGFFDSDGIEYESIDDPNGIVCDSCGYEIHYPYEIWESQAAGGEMYCSGCIAIEKET